MTDLLTASPSRLADYNLRSARIKADTALHNAVWVCRHMRQRLDDVEAWTRTKFSACFNALLDIVSKEWEQPGE